MRLDLFEELAPICPRCLHFEQAVAPLRVAERLETRGDHLWQGMLHCSNQSCWMEFPVIDGVPIITPDPQETMRQAQAQIMARSNPPAALAGVLGDALGQSADFDRNRLHLGLYGWAHYSDWAGGEPASLAAISECGLASVPVGEGVAMDLGCSVGRTTWEMADGRTTLGADLNIAMLRLAQTLALEGRVSFDLRRIGLVYDRVEVELPNDMAGRPVDFWAVDCLALPFRAGAFGLACAVNLVDCIAAPTNLLHETARVVAPGAGAWFTTPYDWSETVTEKAAWLGGHSGRSPHAGAGEPVLTATLEQAGFDVIAEDQDVPWRLRMHARSVMHYSLHLVGCIRR